jgi:hypothetical protein
MRRRGSAVLNKSSAVLGTESTAALVRSDFRDALKGR